jgi:hypothetical protein
VQAVKRSLAAAGVIAALLTPAALAGPASAGSGTTQVGCTTGDSCTIMLRQLVKFSGDYSPGTNNTVVDITPPPCLWKPIGDATTGSQYIINFFSGVNPGPAGPYQTGASFTQAKTLVNQTPKPAGEWYELPVNPAASAAQQAVCLTEPLFFWAVQTADLPNLDIPPVTLAQLAFAGVKTPKAGNPQLNPVGKSVTNLPTFVRLALQGNVRRTAAGRPYVTVTALIPGGNSATIWLEAGSFNITSGASATQATPYDRADCSRLGNGNTLGTKTAAAAMSQTKANQAIDCGVTYRQPGTFTLTTSVGWVGCWAPGINQQPPAFATCQANPIPGAANLQSTSRARQVNVQEIQSING